MSIATARSIRIEAARLSLNWHTPIPYWLSLPLDELSAWGALLDEATAAAKEK